MHDENRRRSITELAVRYQREPELRDVYVEGRTDSAFFEWFLRNTESKNVIVYEIETVTIDMDILIKHHLDDGERGRVIALAHELEGQIDHPHQVTCIADRDFDVIAEREFDCSLLILTDFSCLELYAFNEETLHKFINVFVRDFSVTPTSMIQNLSIILVELFLIRYTSIKLNMGMSWVEFTKNCKSKKHNISFDADAFIQKYLQKNSQWDFRESYRDELERLRSKVLRDHRFYIRGHDLANLMAFYLNNYSKYQIYSEEVVGRALLLSLEHEELKSYPLFKSLMHRVTN